MAVAVGFDGAEQVPHDLFLPAEQRERCACPSAFGVAQRLNECDSEIRFALLLTCGDGEQAAEVYGCAADRQQASIVFEVAADMIRQSPALSKRVKILSSQKRIIYKPTNSFYQVLSARRIRSMASTFPVSCSTTCTPNPTGHSST